MKISARKSQMLYKNEDGGRIMVRISLPKADSDCELESLYRTLCECYLDAAKKYINARPLKESFFLDVSFSAEEKEKEIKIKRLANLKQGAKIIKSKVITDIFDIGNLSLKK